MIGLPKKLFYAVEAVLYIAYNSAGEPTSSRDIARMQNLPPRYLEQMMQRLVHAGILRGIRGPRGGYVLARDKRRISVADICQAIHEEDAEDSATATPLSHKVLSPLWHSLDSKLMDQLTEVTMADLCDQALAQQVKKAGQARYDFAI